MNKDANKVPTFEEFFKKKIASRALSDVFEGMLEKSKHTPDDLREALAKYQERIVFKPGDLVTNKPGMSETTVPKDGQCAICMEVIEGRRNTTPKAAATPYEYEPSEMRIGVFSSNGDFMGFWVDMNRFQHYTGETEAEETTKEE